MSEPTTPRVTGSPDSIWLVYGDIERDCTHAECGEVTWCDTKQHDSDVQYLRADKAAAARVRVVCVLEQQNYRPGDQAPEGYLAWHEWAEVQHKAGLRQKQCGRCGLWRYPQQLSAELDRAELVMTKKRKSRRVTVETPVCNDCHKTPNVRGKRLAP